jgi:hypothetical protein
VINLNRIPSYSDSLHADIQPSYTDSLYHHGILGMHWGVRRYQNPDGSLTAAGKARYNTNSSYFFKGSDEKYDIKTAAKNSGVDIHFTDQVSYSDVRKDPNFDKKTGLLKKTSEMSNVDDAIAVNPRASNFSLFHSNRRYYVNCTHCTVAYDLRRRGYDVAATPMTRDYGENGDAIHKMYPKAEIRNVEPEIKSKNYTNWLDSKVDENKLNSMWWESLDHAWDNPKEYEAACKKQGEQILNTCESYGPNARGNILIHIASGGGHSLAFENDSKGKTTFIDSQTMSLKNGKNDSMGGKGSSYYKNIICMADPYFNAEVIRYDNTTPDYKFLNKNKIVNNPEIVTKTDIFGNSKTFKMYQHDSKAFK